MKQKDVNKLNEERLKDISNSPAFPLETSYFNYFGMSKREYIATQVLPSVINRYGLNLINNKYLDDDGIDVTSIAIHIADKLIEKLNTNLDK